MEHGKTGQANGTGLELKAAYTSAEGSTSSEAGEELAKPG